MRNLMKILSISTIVVTCVVFTSSCEKDNFEPTPKEPQEAVMAQAPEGQHGEPDLSGPPMQREVYAISVWDGSLVTFNGSAIPERFGEYSPIVNYVGAGTGSVYVERQSDTGSEWSDHFIPLEIPVDEPLTWDFDYSLKSNEAADHYVQVSIRLDDDRAREEVITMSYIEGTAWVDYSTDIMVGVIDALDYLSADYSDLAYISIYVRTSGDVNGGLVYLDGIELIKDYPPTATPTISGPTSFTISWQDFTLMEYLFVYGFGCTYGHDDYEWELPFGVVNLGQNGNTITLGFNTTGTKTIKCKVKDEGDRWSAQDSHNFTLIIN